MNDAKGLPLPNDKMRLFREHRYLETTTDASGGYTFPNLAAGSYLLLPKLYQCHFLPPDADLDHLASSTTQDFSGFGLGCGGDPTVNMGATSGPLTIGGHIKDASGQPILGARVDLGEHTRGIRFTDLTGSYTFHVKPGDYDLQASGTCSFTPTKVKKDDLKANTVQDFTAGPGCVTVTATQSNPNPTGSVITISKGGTVLGTTYVRIEQRASAADASVRLNEIAAEQPTPTRSLTIAGYPAVERQTLVTLPGPGPEIAGNAGDAGPFLALTTAIAVGNNVVRFESQLPATANAATIALFFQSARNFTPDELPSLHGPARTPVPMTHNTPPSSPSAPSLSAPGVVAPGTFGELEVTASDTANAVVYGTQSGPFLSTDGGQTVKAATYNTAAAQPSAAFSSLGDPAVAVGAPDGTFHQNIYFAQLEQAAPKPAAPPNNFPVVAIGLYQSTDNGATFNSVSFPVNCSVAAAGCVVPDQEHLVADRINRAVTSAGSFDQLYLAWRNFTSQASNAHTIAVACSTDGGLNWTTDLTTLNTTGGDFPKLSVGPDGSFLVAYGGFSGATYSLNVQKWSSCASGFNPTGKQVQVVKTVTEVTDMPGLDRPPGGNYSPAFDDSDGSAQRIFVVYSNEATAGNDDVHVAESTDGGATWARDSIVSTVSTGRRYFPWICSTVGKKFVTWYDRRNSTAASPDLTSYYWSTVFDNGTPTSVGTGTETNASGVDDPQCSPGFFGSVRGAIEESGCKNLPAGFIQGGQCQTATCAPGKTPPCGTLAACDFRAATPCATAGETCSIIAGAGIPKYGDYNGSGCALGTLFTAWASATPPKGVGCLVAGMPSASAAKCCSGNISSGACAPTAAACTPNGGACGGGIAACCSAGLNGQCQAGKCLPAIAVYTGSSNIVAGSPGTPVIITYHQTGACNGYVTGSGWNVGPNAAGVFFGIEEIDNSGGSISFAFDPTNLYVQQAKQDFVDPFLSVYKDILGPFAAGPVTLTPGQDIKYAVSAQNALVVSTTATDGSTEANQTKYFLQYNRQPTDPLITLVKSDASRTSWPNTQDCTTITLK